MSVSVRLAEGPDAPAIRRVHLAAFPTAMEAELVEQLESEGDAVLSVLAEDRGEVVGHVLLSRMRVRGGGNSYRALGLAPVAVLPSRQREGIGGALIREAIERARAGGEQLLFLVGEPDYYRRFGFDAAAAAPFRSPYAGSCFMALALAQIEPPASGSADYARAFAALGEAE